MRRTHWHDVPVQASKQNNLVRLGFGKLSSFCDRNNAFCSVGLSITGRRSTKMSGMDQRHFASMVYQPCLTSRLPLKGPPQCWVIIFSAVLSDMGKQPESNASEDKKIKIRKGRLNRFPILRSYQKDWKPPVQGITEGLTADRGDNNKGTRGSDE